MVVIVDYGVGNLVSIQNMLKKTGVKAIISNKQQDVEQAEKIILPGMGHFDNCMKKLNASGLRPAIEEKVLGKKIPVLGICVGLQMYMGSSEEGVESGLGWIKGVTVRFNTKEMNDIQKIPNMGWLDLNINTTPSPLLEGLEGGRFYFAHSYHIQLANEEHSLATAHYGYYFSVGAEMRNILGVQFHPEKSHRFGMKLLHNFVKNY
jgi:imidazole glycerol-phosphate synthase subunit HisH